MYRLSVHNLGLESPLADRLNRRSIECPAGFGINHDGVADRTVFGDSKLKLDPALYPAPRCLAGIDGFDLEYRYRLSPIGAAPALQFRCCTGEQSLCIDACCFTAGRKGRSDRSLGLRCYFSRWGGWRFGPQHDRGRWIQIGFAQLQGRKGLRGELRLWCCRWRSCRQMR